MFDQNPSLHHEADFQDHANTSSNFREDSYSKSSRNERKMRDKQKDKRKNAHRDEYLDHWN